MQFRLVVALGLVALGACKCPGPKPPPPPVVEAAHPGPPAEAAAFPGDEPVRAVYDLTGAIEPRAQRLCDALYTLPDHRRAECCRSSPTATVTDLCARTLSAALRLSSVTVDDAALTACEAAMAAEHQGCDWVGLLPPLPAPACASVLVGKLMLGDRCRSSLECPGTQRCQGSGPTDVGVCTGPRATGSCNTSIDALGGILRLDIERSHPACAGFCERSHCIPTKALGDVCTRNLQCPPGSHCGKGTCVAGDEAELGSACLGAPCKGGARCLNGICAMPKAAGEVCQGPFDCRGACLHPDGGAPVCGMKCP